MSRTMSSNNTRIATQIMDERVYHDLYIRVFEEKRYLQDVLTDLIREALKLGPSSLVLPNVPEELKREISIYASLSGRTLEQQILFDLSEAYGGSYNE
jgi:hypothetical protein